ncbi:hypothetical protein FNF27_00773 [Cafeteria roenbergensis]|uniref:Carboxypeptidase n=2 Tax=Cafeteria roenbergensis TaxID=33653 RepID=A0A5A8EI19_CAFRO|nr:hypothetical protein FNF27_00773 [Cafeteria roenbergensis]
MRSVMAAIALSAAFAVCATASSLLRGVAPEEPVDLTSLIRAGRLDEARDAARVTLPADVLVPGSGADKIESYAGLFQVGSDTPGCPAGDRKLFAWYVPPTDPSAVLSEAGTLMWMQGGPGGSGTFGFLSENGPLVVNAALNKLEPREYSWSSFQGGLWVDQPLATGFSTIKTDACLVNTSGQAADDVVDLLDQWAALFPEAASGPFRIAGESYGGTYAPWTAVALMDADASVFPHASALASNLDAVLLGDPWTDALAQMPAYGTMLRGFSIADEIQSQQLDAYFKMCVDNVTTGTLEGRLAAFKLWDAFWGDYNPTGFTSGYEAMSGCPDTLNVERCQYPAGISLFSAILARDDVKQALHVPGRVSGSNSSKVYRQFAEVSGSFMLGSRAQVETLLHAGKRVLYYHGAVDAICGAVTGDAAIRALVFPGASTFASTPRVTWKVDKADTSSAGWVVEADGLNLSWAVLRNAGHLVPFDQPRAAFAMMQRFVTGKPLAQ